MASVVHRLRETFIKDTKGIQTQEANEPDLFLHQ